MPRFYGTQKKQSASSSRFENVSELNHVNTLIRLLRTKENELVVAAASAKHARENEATNELSDETETEKKYNVVSQLVGALEECIKDFDLKQNPSDRVTRLEDIVNLANQMQVIVKTTLGTSSEILKFKRNDNRSHAGTLLKVATVGSTCIAAISCQFSTGAAAIGAALFGTEKVKETVGLNKVEAKSYELTNELLKTLNKLIENITSHINELKNPPLRPM